MLHSQNLIGPGGHLKIGLAQMRVVAGDLPGNLNRVKEYIHKARMQGCEGIVFPEMCLSGYLMGDRWESSSWLREIQAANEEVRALSQGLWVVFGSLGMLPHRKNEDGRIGKCSAAFLAKDEKWIVNPETGLGFFPKTLSPNYRIFDDSRFFQDLRDIAPKLDETLGRVELSGIPVGLTVCEDLWEENYAQKPSSILASQVSLLLNLSCSPFSEAKEDKRIRLLSSLAKSGRCFVCYVNCVGTQNNGKTVLGLDGQSVVIDPNGQIVAQGGFFSEELMVLDLNLANGTASQATTAFVETPFKELGSTKVGALENTLHFVCHEWRIKNTVIGSSGGIDSAVSSTLFARVLGPENVLLVNMPSKFNSTLTQNLSKELATSLGCDFASIPIQDSVNFSKQQILASNLQKTWAQPQWSSWVDENVQARDRSSRVLAALAASLNSVFPCNANKTESTVGYSTLYGDQSGFLCPLADLWKFEIYELARQYNLNVYGSEVIPKGTLDVVPSAELSDSQDVTKGLGDPLHYPYHDRLFRSWIEGWDRWTPLDVLESYLKGTLSKDLDLPVGVFESLFSSPRAFVEDLERWWNLYTGLGAVKRMQAPPVLSVSRRSFGYDHREALGATVSGSLYCAVRNSIFKPR